MFAFININRMTMETGNKYQTYYGNGSECGIITISRMTDKSIFHTRDNSQSNSEYRDSINSVNRYLSKGLWKEITKNVLSN